MTETPIEPGNYVTQEALALLAKFDITAGITFYPDFDMSRISRTSMTGQVRLETIDKDHLAGMVADANEHPDKDWPAILVWPIGDGSKFDVLNGVHRTKMTQETGRTTFPVVVVDLSTQDDPPQMAQRLKIAANQSNGLPMQQIEKVLNAMSLVEVGVPRNQAAADAGINRQTLVNHIQESEVKERMIAVGLKNLVDSNAFTQEVLLRARNIGNDEPFRVALLLALSSGLNGTEQKALFNEVAGIGDQTRQLAFLESENQRLENRRNAVAAGVNGKGKPVVTRGQRMQTRLSGLVANQFNPEVVLSLYQTPAAQVEALHFLEDMTKELNETMKALRKAAVAAGVDRDSLRR